MVLFTFVNIPYDAWIINWTGDEKWTISRPLEVQHVFPVKSIPEKVSKHIKFMQENIYYKAPNSEKEF